MELPLHGSSKFDVLHAALCVKSGHGQAARRVDGGKIRTKSTEEQKAFNCPVVNSGPNFGPTVRLT
jgi:hypothetical protein